jgi:hypothetical protein
MFRVQGLSLLRRAVASSIPSATTTAAAARPSSTLLLQQTTPRLVLGTAARAMGTHASLTDMSAAGGLNGTPPTHGGAGGGGAGAHATLAELIDREVSESLWVIERGCWGQGVGDMIRLEWSPRGLIGVVDRSSGRSIEWSSIINQTIDRPEGTD